MHVQRANVRRAHGHHVSGTVQVYVKFEGGNPEDIREEAVFGLVQSGGDAAYAYLDRPLSRR